MSQPTEQPIEITEDTMSEGSNHDKPIGERDIIKSYPPVGNQGEPLPAKLVDYMEKLISNLPEQ